MPGKVTIIIIAKYYTTKELEDKCHEMTGYWLGQEEHLVYVVPSDDGEDIIREEYLV